MAAPADDGYRVRRLTPADAPGVRALAQRVYGSTYFHDEVYDPDKLLRMNESGHLITAVAIDPADHVVGHYALERPDLGLIPETGEAMILPEHRGHHLLPRLRAFLEEQARQHSFVGLWGTPVTAHVFSQKVYQEFHCHPTGIFLGGVGGSYSDLTGAEAKQRASALTYFKYLVPPPPAEYHLPPRHQDLVRQICTRLGRDARFAADAAPAGDGRLETDFRDRDHTGFILVTRIGEDSLDQMTAAIVAHRRRSCEAIFLQLPLEQPGTVALCMAAESAGFFFCGLRPRAPGDGDMLRLQLLDAPLDMDLLHVDEAFARTIVDYVAAERRRVAS
jgi:hypothetical protein